MDRRLNPRAFPCLHSPFLHNDQNRYFYGIPSQTSFTPIFKPLLSQGHHLPIQPLGTQILPEI
ncbi:hypothetical protein PVK06_034273 [Gossypium arboreum]|uniref:Uncharacterized protein n=1 Tax=Gossypium arboreum TaxID=29729 RepID=A0ABR0NDR8_GOSAR|nr:hypothetical protein PVK06_034273 [Gossypium arboreum]